MDFEPVVIGSRAGKKSATVARDESVVNAARRTGAAVDTFAKGSGNTQKSGTDHGACWDVGGVSCARRDARRGLADASTTTLS